MKEKLLARISEGCLAYYLLNHAADQMLTEESLVSDVKAVMSLPSEDTSYVLLETFCWGFIAGKYGMSEYGDLNGNIEDIPSKREIYEYVASNFKHLKDSIEFNLDSSDEKIVYH